MMGLGEKKIFGHPTCHKGNASVVDFADINDAMLPFCADFNVEIFDKCISDVHYPASLQLIFSQHVNLENNPTWQRFPESKPHMTPKHF